MTKPSERDISAARLLRPLGGNPMSMEQAKVAAQLLGVHWTTVYRLRKRYLLDPVTSSIAARPSGPKDGASRIGLGAEAAISEMSGALRITRDALLPILDAKAGARRAT